MRFSKKSGVGEMLEVARPGWGKGMIVLKKGSGQASPGVRKIDEAEGGESILFSRFGEFREVHVGSNILVSWGREWIGGGGMPLEGGEGSCGSGGVVEVGGGHAVI